jgi:hypothetical protein
MVQYEIMFVLWPLLRWLREHGDDGSEPSDRARYVLKAK